MKPQLDLHVFSQREVRVDNIIFDGCRPAHLDRFRSFIFFCSFQLSRGNNLQSYRDSHLDRHLDSYLNSYPDSHMITTPIATWMAPGDRFSLFPSPDPDASISMAISIATWMASGNSFSLFPSPDLDASISVAPSSSFFFLFSTDAETTFY